MRRTRFVQMLSVTAASVGLVLAGAAAPALAAAAPNHATPHHAAPTASWIFALDSGGTLVKIPAQGGKPVTVRKAVSDYAVDSSGDAFAVSGSTVLEVSSKGSVKTIARHVTGVTDIALDVKHDVYLQKGSSVVEIPVGSTRQQTVATAPVTDSVIGFHVAPSGAVFLFEVGPADRITGSPTYVVTYSAVKHVRSTVVLDPTSDPTRYVPTVARFDDDGDAYFRLVASNGSGATQIYRAAAHTSPVTQLRQLTYLVDGVGLSNQYVLASTASSCDAHLLAEGLCVPDLRVPTLVVYQPSGASKTFAVKNFSLTAEDATPVPTATTITTDRAGRIIVTQPAGIAQFVPGRGVLVTLVKGSFTNVQVTD